MSDFWRQWEDHVVDGRFPLRRFLGESNHSAVFLTECGEPRAEASIKFIRDDPAFADVQLERWRAAGALSHPRLIRLFESGHCKLGHHGLLFVVMEYAEQTLAEILALRALTFDEVREMADPALAALSFLHRNGWVHGQVKPPNICVVRDELKLSSDTLRPAGERLSGSVDPTPFSAPEERRGDASAAGDLWGIGMTLVAALTQHPAPAAGAPSGDASIPSTVPPAFADAVRRCLSADAGRRPTAAELRAQLTAAKPDPPVPEAPPHAAHPPAAQSPAAEPTAARPPAAETLLAAPSRPSRSDISRARLVGGLLVLLGVIWGSVRLMHGGHASGPTRLNPSSSIPGAPAATAASQTVSRAVGPSLPQPAVPSDPVLHKEIPAVPRSALRSVHGRIQVSVTVAVDASGDVIQATLEHSGSSKYFARAAAAAARKWRFAPVAASGARKWRLRFEFTRAGASANALPMS